MTLKGTYNQGLSYYWADFVGMIQFASDMLDRLGKIVDGRRIDPNQKADIKLWLERARENAVSYNHLKLPTKVLVVSSVVAESVL